LHLDPAIWHTNGRLHTIWERRIRLTPEDEVDSFWYLLRQGQVEKERAIWVLLSLNVVEAVDEDHSPTASGLPILA